MTIKLRESLMAMVQAAAKENDVSVEVFVSHILNKHFHDKLAASMPSTKEIILGNIKSIAAGTTFTVIDVMDSLHKRDPKKRREYGSMLSLLIARREVHAYSMDVMKDTFKVYRKH